MSIYDIPSICWQTFLTIPKNIIACFQNSVGFGFNRKIKQFCESGSGQD